MYKKMPKNLVDFIKTHQSTGYNCTTCTDSCCYESGFAIKENVELIYRKYQSKTLIRNDYHFKENLSYEEFTHIYFDIIRLNAFNITLYFPRHVAYNDVALIIDPPTDRDYWEYRHSILSDPINENKGCIFLSNKLVIGSNITSKCILHDSTKSDYIYEKPVDCILLSCNSMNRVVPLSAQSNQDYFLLLSREFGTIQSD